MRKILFKLHSWMALVALLPVFVVSLTGSILVFKSEIDRWLMPQAAALPYGDQAGAAFNRQHHMLLQETVERRFPDYIIGSWEIFTDGKQADLVYLIKKGSDDWYKIYFDPQANAVLSQPVSLTSNFTDWLLKLHYTFLLNDLALFTDSDGEHSQWGTLLGLLIAVILTFLGISGLILHRKFWLQLLSLRLGKSWRIFSGDLHRLVGAWASPVILILGITGMYFNAMAVYHELFEHPSEQHYRPEAPLYGEQIDFQNLLDDSRQQLDNFTPTYLLYPYEPEVNITIFGHQPGANPFASLYASSVTYDRLSGTLLSASNGNEASIGNQIIDSFRELHFGSFAGLISKIIWCVLGLSPVLLGVSGLYIWRYRHVRKRPARATSPLVAEAH